MVERQPMNVSLPAEQEQFVRSQVASGRYGSASEVVRDGLRLLEQAEHQRLLEKWLLQGELSEEEEASLPSGLLEKAKARLRAFVEEGLEAARQGKLLDGPETVKQIRQELEARRLRESA
jgi:antitoxin ParD1/3/4